MIRIQVFYSKTGAFRYTGNLDIHKAWERIFRRADLPIAYSQGFHPQPRLNQANPLPLGLAGRDELIEAWLNADQWQSDFLPALEVALPPGIAINRVNVIPLDAPTPQSRMVAADYLAEITPPVPPAELEERIQEACKAEKLVRERRGKSYDLRPLILDLRLEQAGSGQNTCKIYMRLAAGPHGSGRPDEVLSALGLDPHAADIERVRLVFME